MEYHRRMRFARFSPAAVLLTFALAACGSSSATPEAKCVSTYWDGTIGTCLPAGWSALSREEVQARGMPPEVQFAFQAVQAVAGQYPTVTVTTETLREPLTSEDYSKASVDVVSRRKDYSQIDLQDITIDGTALQLHVFSAQPLTDEPKQRFYQIALTKGSVGYVFTAALPLSAPDALAEEVQLLLKSVSMREPEGVSEEE